MNATVGRGKVIHATNGSYANCGKGMGANSLTATTEAVTCKARQCQDAAAEATATYEVTYRKNTIARGWVTKTTRHTTTEAGITKIAANMINHPAYVLLSSVKVS